MKLNNCFSRGRKAGFTLIEMLVVIVILTTLVGLGAMGVSRTLKGAERTKRNAYAQTVQSAIAAYKAENNAFPMGNSASSGYATLAFGLVDNRKIDTPNVEVMMELLGRDSSGKRVEGARAYLTDTSILYVCEGKRVSRLNDALDRGSISSKAAIGFPLTMNKTGNSTFKKLSNARAFAPIQISFDLELDDSSVSIPGEGDFTQVIEL